MGIIEVFSGNAARIYRYTLNGIFLLIFNS